MVKNRQHKNFTDYQLYQSTRDFAILFFQKECSSPTAGIETEVKPASSRCFL